MALFSFRKEERLYKKKQIQELFDKGSSFYLFPFKIIVLPHPDATHPVHQVLISVSSKNFRRAVDRNLIKRRIREAYRLQKAKLRKNPKLTIAFLYTAKEILPFEEIGRKLLLAMARIEKEENSQVRKA